MALREIAAEFDIRINGSEKLDTVNQKLDKGGMLSDLFGGKLRELGTVLAGAFAFRELGDFVRKQAELGEELEKTALKTGLSVQQLQRLQYAAGQSGISAESLVGAIGKLEMQLGGGLGGKGGPAIAALQQMKVHTKDATGKSRELVDVLTDAADKIAKTEDPNKRAAMSMQLFGRSGRELLPFLLKGKDGIQDLMKEADKLGFVLGTDFTESAKKAEEEQRKLEWSWRTAKATLGQQLFPAFKAVLDKVIGAVQWFQDLAKHTTLVTTGLSALSFVAGVKLFGAVSKLMGFSKGGGLLGNLFGMAKLAGVLIGIALLYVAWDELFGLFTGKKTVIGDLIDQVYGKGQSTKDVNDLKNAWKSVLDTILGAGKATGDWDEIWGSFKSTLMTDLAAIVHSVMTLVTLLMKSGNLATTLAVETGKALAGKGFDTKKLSDAFDEVKTAAKGADFSALGGALTPALTKPLATGYKGQIEVGRKYDNLPEGATARDFAGTGIKRESNITVHQTNHINSDQPDKVKNAISQGTGQALSQGDLRNTQRAVASRAPSQGGEAFVP